MSETANIEQLAKIISNDIFQWLKWEQSPLTDVNWSCEQEHHNKKTHPSDVVYHYIHPYNGNRIYLNTDLKSYKKNSIGPSSVQNALTTLALSVDCANISHDWQNKFHVDDEYYAEAVGLLFIYNHDNEFDRDFHKLLSDVDRKKIKIAEGNKIFVFGPQTINYLLDVITDIKGLIAEESLPNRSGYTFYYPDLVMSKRHGEEWEQSASIELLTSPWMIIKHKESTNSPEGYLIYYRSRGNTVDEFIYFLDTLSHYQLLLHGNPIRLRFVGSDQEAILNFNKAKHQYLKSWGPDPARERQLNLISSGFVSTIQTKFNPLEMGMRDA